MIFFIVFFVNFLASGVQWRHAILLPVSRREQRSEGGDEMHPGDLQRDDEGHHRDADREIPAGHENVGGSGIRPLRDSRVRRKATRTGGEASPCSGIQARLQERGIEGNGSGERVG